MDETYIGGKPRKGSVKAKSVSKDDLSSVALQSLVRNGIDLANAVFGMTLGRMMLA